MVLSRDRAFDFDLSVLVTPTKSGGSLVSVLSSLARKHESRGSAEIVVVVPETDRNPNFESKVAALRDLGLPVTVLEVHKHAPADVPRWRALAFKAARGRVRVFLEDNAVVESGWWSAWFRAAERDDWTIATGVVEPDRERLLPAAAGVFFCEYGLFVPHSSSGSPAPLKRVAGNHWAVHGANVTHEESLIEIDEHAWTHRHTNSRSKPFWNVDARVKCFREVRAGEAIAERARQGFRFGRQQAGKSGAFKKIQMMHGGPAILIIQIVRLVYVVAARRNERLYLARSLPCTILLLKAWSFSEWAGWCFGSFEALFHANLKHRSERLSDSSKSPRSGDQIVVNPDQRTGSTEPRTHERGRNPEVDLRMPS